MSIGAHMTAKRYQHMTGCLQSNSTIPLGVYSHPEQSECVTVYNDCRLCVTVVGDCVHALPWFDC